jgi:hypothetical protein
MKKRKIIILSSSVLLISLLIIGFYISTPDRLSWIKYKEVGPLKIGKFYFLIQIVENSPNLFTIKPRWFQDEQRKIVPRLGGEYIETPSHLETTNIPKYDIFVVDTTILSANRNRLLPIKEGSSIVFVKFPYIAVTESLRVEVYSRDSVLAIRKL